MALPTENPRKILNIVGNNMANFRRLYLPLIETLPNVDFTSQTPFSTTTPDWTHDDGLNLRLAQDMDPVKRSNMVRRLPKAFRARLYERYQRKLAIPSDEFKKIMDEGRQEDSVAFRRRTGGGFERRIAQDDPAELRNYIRAVIRQTISWPATTQSLKGPLTSGWSRTWRYLKEKMEKYKQGKREEKEAEEQGKKEGDHHAGVKKP
jgi:translocator assembly and maintenance protein 41